MTQPGPSSRPSGVFAADAEAAALRALQDADTALTAADLKQALRDFGVAEADLDRAWPRVQRRIRWHDHVIVEAGHRYRWAAQPPVLSVADVWQRLTRSGLTTAKRAALVALVRGATADSASDAEEAARRRQGEIDAVRALAELASEVEELTANDASSGALIHRIRARVKRNGLEPIDRAGEETTFDRARHKPIGRPIGDGTKVVVVRPGYVWKASAEDVLIAKAIVEE